MKYRKWIFGTDSHGDQEDPATVRAFHNFVKHWKPEIRIHGGDAFDIRWLRGKASDEEKRERIEADLNAGIRFLKTYKPTHFLFGNHDARLTRAVKSDDGKLAALASGLLDEIHDALGHAKVFPWGKRDGVFNMDGLRFLHGYHSGVNAARQCAMVYGNSVMGHVHSQDSVSLAHIAGRTVGHTAACLCLTNLDYNLGQVQTLRQSNGWVYGLTLGKDRHIVWHADMINGAMFLPSEMKDFAA